MATLPVKVQLIIRAGEELPLCMPPPEGALFPRKTQFVTYGEDDVVLAIAPPDEVATFPVKKQLVTAGEAELLYKPAPVEALPFEMRNPSSVTLLDPATQRRAF